MKVGRRTLLGAMGAASLVRPAAAGLAGPDVPLLRRVLIVEPSDGIRSTLILMIKGRFGVEADDCDTTTVALRRLGQGERYGLVLHRQSTPGSLLVRTLAGTSPQPAVITIRDHGEGAIAAPYRRWAALEMDYTGRQVREAVAAVTDWPVISA